MKALRNNFLKTLLALILTINIVSVFIIPKQADAQTVFGTGTHLLTTRVGTLITDEKWIQDYILKPAVRIVVRQLLQETTNMIVRWIQGNNGSNVGYVKNPQQFFRNVADKAGGEFLNQLSGVNLCGNIGAFLQISLRTPPTLQQKLACSLTNIVQNVNSFYRNFNNGGWRAFISASVEPQNNPYGAYLLALQAKVDAESSAVDSGLLKLKASYPFLGFEVETGKRCSTRPSSAPTGDAPGGFSYNQLQQNISPSGQNTRNFAAIGSNLFAETTPGVEQDSPYRSARDIQDERQLIESGLGDQQPQGESGDREVVCETEYETKTPGQLIQSQLSKAVGSGIDFAISAKEIDEAVATIVTALINKVINSSVLAGDGRSGGSGVFNPDAGNIQLTSLENANFFVARIQTNLTFADSIIISLDNSLKDSYQQLFVLRRNPPPQTPEEPSSVNTIRILEDKIFNLHRTKKEILSIKTELLNLKRTIISTTDARQLVDLSSQIPLFSSRLGSAASRAEAGINAIPTTSTGSQKWDTVQEIQGNIDTISSTLTLVNTMADEANRIASTTTVSGRKSELERLSADLLNRTSRPLETMRNNLTLIKDRLTRAISNEEIQIISAEAMAALEQVNTPLRNADDAVQRADAALKQP